jgi:hypothetical protein
MLYLFIPNLASVSDVLPPFIFPQGEVLALRNSQKGNFSEGVGMSKEALHRVGRELFFSWQIAKE